MTLLPTRRRLPRGVCRLGMTEEQGPNACRVDWRGTFEPDGVPEEQAQAMVRGIYTGGIAGVRKLLGVA